MIANSAGDAIAREVSDGETVEGLLGPSIQISQATVRAAGILQLRGPQMYFDA